jgi:ribosomal protein S18 acetylase RimI-like enzyme
MSLPKRAVRTYLEMSDPADLSPSPAPSRNTRIEREADCAPALWRSLYTEVGRQYNWVDRLAWTDDEIARYLSDPALELWILRMDDVVAGYFELRKDAEGAVEIAYFGLMPDFIGQGLGKYLLTRAVERAWERGATRVWLHTSSLDHSSALSNYLSRGFSVWKQESYDV